MTYEKIKEMLVALGDDVKFSEETCNGVPALDVVFQDFKGFEDEDDWCEIYRDYDDAQAVEDFQEILSSKARNITGDFYTIYEFDGFTVVTGYSSLNI